MSLALTCSLNQFPWLLAGLPGSHPAQREVWVVKRLLFVSGKPDIRGRILQMPGMVRWQLHGRSRTGCHVHSASSWMRRRLPKFMKPSCMADMNLSKRRPPFPRGIARRDVLLTLAVTALVLGVAAPRLLQRQQHPEASVARVQLEALNKALQSYRMDVGRYPSDAQGLQALVQPPGDVERARWHGPYYPDTVVLDPWGHPFVYRFQGTVGRGYELYSLGRDHVLGGQGENADIGR